MEAIWDMGLVVLAVVLLGILLILAFKRRSKDDILREAAGQRDIYRDIYAGFGHPDEQPRLDSMRKRFADEQVREGRKIEKHSMLAAGYRKPPLRAITFTPRQLERVNIQRRLRGAVPLNKRGFQGAAATAATTPGTQPQTNDQWLNYFIFYQLFLADHGSPRTTVDHHFTINPDKPFNGQGGTFGGAGASGAWDAPQAAVDPVAGNPSPAAALTAGAAIGAAAYLLNEDRPAAPDPIATGDLPSGGAMAAFLNDRPDGPLVGDGPGAAVAPEPSYSPPARDPEPSYSPPSAPEPSSSSYSDSSSSSSSSYDSGSSGGGGGDSGGGGGGGGGD